MSDVVQIPAPPSGFAREVRYAIRPREKRAFRTVLDANRMLDASGRESRVAWSSDGGDLLLATDHPILGGTLRERVRYAPTAGGLVTRSLEREVVDAGGQGVRREQVVDYRHDLLGLPLATYPEVTLPFLLGWLPLDGKRRSLYAWINDRFVAKLYVEAAGRETLALPSGRRDAAPVLMYPDLNDWVHLGSMLTRLAKPFVPKWHLWFDPAPPHALLRFEGPYGPPGAPEIVLERLSD